MKEEGFMDGRDETYPISELTCGSDCKENYDPPRVGIRDYDFGGILEGRPIPEYLTNGRQKKRGPIKTKKPNNVIKA